MLSLAGIILSIILIMFLSFKKKPLYVYATLCALFVAAMDGCNPFDVFSTTYVQGLGDYFTKNLLLFCSSAVFAAFMDKCGAARYIALKISGLALKTKNSKFVGLMCMALVQIVLTAGGINLFVVIFLLVSINRIMYEKLDIPWNLFLANSWACGTLTVWALPGMPSIQNLIPTTYLGTDAMAGAGLGIFMAVEITVLCIGYVIFCLKRAERKGEHFLPQGAAVKAKEIDVNTAVEEIPNMNLFTALLPSIVVLLVMNVIKFSAIVSLLLGCAVCWILFRKQFRSVSRTIAGGIEDGMSVLLPVAFMTGYGAVVAGTRGFTYVIEALRNIPGPEVFQVYIAANVAACVCGSVSGGLGILYTSLGDYFRSMDLSMELVHRVSVAGASGLDTMPFAASIHSLMRVASIEFSWDSYKYIFTVNLVLTIITGLSGVALVALGVFH